MNSTRLSIVAAFLLLATGCATIGDRGQPLVPTQFQTRTGPYIVFTNYALPVEEGVVKQLVDLQSQIEATLGFRVEAGEHPIEVYILADRKSFEHFLTFYYPDLPQRRAFFIAQANRRVVYTFKGDRLEEDIRHEATHALLNLALGEIPLWLDEGLAEFFEVSNPTGLNREHLARLPQDIKEGWSPSLERLEALKSVRRLSPRDYRESWAWVHFLLNSSGDGRAALLAYVGDLRGSGEAKPLSTRLSSSPTERGTVLTAYIGKIRNGNPEPIATSDPTVRFQDAPIEIEPIEADPASKRRGVFGRLLSRIVP